LDAFAVQKAIIKSSEPVIFDVGAHIGEVAEAYRDLFPSASIYCFEPFRQSFEELQQKSQQIAHKGGIYNLAISDRKGGGLLNANVSSATNSLLPLAPESKLIWGIDALETKGQVEVMTTTIDSFCQENGISAIDILKLDIHAAEFLALLGAKNMLSSQKISVIYLEIIMSQTYEGQHKLHEYLSMLDDFDYELLDLYEPWRNRMELLQADFLFLRKGLKQALREMAKT